ncbi:MAG: DUF1624 domain-containing protein [Caldilineaceae bacterium]|nr:DUF1624 domain-containing protein [Caldilineaceae bacterium]
MSRIAVGTKQKSPVVEPKALSTSRRIWEVDAWRGIAISMMVIFHLMWDLRAFMNINVVLHQGFWFYFQRFTATSFILLVGISLVISYNRARQQEGGLDGLYWKFFQRGLKILGIGMIITIIIALASAFAPGFQGRIDFGVLHFIGTSIIIAYPFLRFRWLNLLFAAIFFAASYAIKALSSGVPIVGKVPLGVMDVLYSIQGTPVDTFAFVWLGFEPANYYYLDYFPLVHWFSVVLIGIFIGNMLYTNGERQFSLPDYSSFFPINLLQFLGRRSLLIYVIHQPILLVLLSVGMVIWSYF